MSPTVFDPRPGDDRWGGRPLEAAAGHTEALWSHLVALSERLGGDGVAVFSSTIVGDEMHLRAVRADPPLGARTWTVPLRDGAPDDSIDPAVGYSVLAHLDPASPCRTLARRLGVADGLVAPVGGANLVCGWVACWASRPGFLDDPADVALIGGAAVALARALAPAEVTPGVDGRFAAVPGHVAGGIEALLDEVVRAIDQVEHAARAVQRRLGEAYRTADAAAGRRLAGLIPDADADADLAGAATAADDESRADGKGGRDGEPPPWPASQAGEAPSPGPGTGGDGRRAGHDHGQESPAGVIADDPGLVDTIERLVAVLEAGGRQHSTTARRQVVEALSGVAETLSDRQTEVLVMLASGYRVKGIADRLGVSASTVRNHVSVILHRLGLRNQIELAEYLAGLRDRSAGRRG